MYSYEIWQWFLLFYFYSFLGWIWETSYVSIKDGRFQNRGFMNGPFLPIYGSGAIAILFAALPVRNSPVLVFVFGMIAATVLELFTGIAMERMFHVRYWDYSYRKIQFRGYICLVSSIAWGVFSCLLIYVIHKPIERTLVSIPEVGAEIMTMALTIICVSDFSTSFKTAIELKQMLVIVEDMKQQAARLEKRAEIVEAFLLDTAEKAKDKAAEDVREHLEDVLGKISATKEDAAQELARIREERARRLDNISTYIAQNSAVYSLLKRNPGAVSVMHSDAMQSFKERVVSFLAKK